LRDVLGRGLSIERAARDRGEGAKGLVAWWGSFFRLCLRVLAIVLGFDKAHGRPAVQ
jgi:hypothetical protein